MEYAKKVLKNVDYEDPFVPFISGFYEFKIPIGGTERRVMWYIPEDARPSTAGILLVPPGKVSIDEFMENSNWIEIADSEETKERLIISVVESGPEGWNVSEEYGNAEGDVAYLTAACQLFSLRTVACVHEAKRYIIGYKDGANMAMMAAMWDPAAYAGAAAIAPTDVPADYISRAETDFALNLYGYEDPGHTHGIKKGDIPVPALLIGEDWLDDSTAAKHFRKICGCAEKAALVDAEIKAYVRETEAEYPVNQDGECYRVWIGKMADPAKDLGKKINRKIWKSFLYPVRRWMGDPGGDLRVTEDPVMDLGMEYHYETVDGFKREWYVYVPDLVAEKPEQKVPLVIACHGYSCTGEIYIGNSEWTRVADDYGFIVAFPTATPGCIDSAAPEGGVSPDNVPLPAWNCDPDAKDRPNEIAFFEHMINDICSEHAIDTGRMYITGHSNGSMITSWLALAKPEWFAAAAPCSGILYMIGTEKCLEAEETKNRKKVELPIWMQGGTEEPWLLDGIPENDNRTVKSIKAWWKLNDMPGEAPDEYMDKVVYNGRWNDWFFDKNRIPMLRYSSIDYMPHAKLPEQSYRIWEDFFSHFSRLEDGTVKYVF